MTTVTDTRTEDDRTETPGQCWDCHGPCVVYAGTAHGWRRRSCLTAHVERTAAAFDDLDARKRRRVMMSYSTSAPPNDDCEGARPGRL